MDKINPKEYAFTIKDLPHALLSTIYSFLSFSEIFNVMQQCSNLYKSGLLHYGNLFFSKKWDELYFYENPHHVFPKSDKLSGAKAFLKIQNSKFLSLDGNLEFNALNSEVSSEAITFVEKKEFRLLGIKEIHFLNVKVVHGFYPLICLTFDGNLLIFHNLKEASSENKCRVVKKIEGFKITKVCVKEHVLVLSKKGIVFDLLRGNTGFSDLIKVPNVPEIVSDIASTLSHHFAMDSLNRVYYWSVEDHLVNTVVFNPFEISKSLDEGEMYPQIETHNQILKYKLKCLSGDKGNIYILFQSKEVFVIEDKEEIPSPDQLLPSSLQANYCPELSKLSLDVIYSSLHC